MSIKNHVIKEEDVRATYKDLIIKQVTFEKKQEIRKFMISKYVVNEQGQPVIETDFTGIEFFKLLITQLTNWADEVVDMSDEELEDILLNGDDTIKFMISEFNKICSEIAEEQKQAFLDIVDRLGSVGESIETQEKVENNLNLLSTKLGISKEQILEMVSDTNKLNELQKLLVEENNKKKLESIPKDHLPKQEKKKRGRRKKMPVIDEKADEGLSINELEKQVAEDEAKLKELQDKVISDGE